MPPKKYPPEAVADAVRRYHAGERVANILAAHAMTPAALYYHVDRAARRSGAPPSRRRVVARTRAGERRPQNALALRLCRTAERFAAAIGRRIDPQQEPAGRSRDLHALRLLGRLCRDLAAFETREAEPSGLAKEIRDAEEDARRTALAAGSARLLEEIRRARRR
jgi:hypothetical protein